MKTKFIGSLLLVLAGYAAGRVSSPSAVASGFQPSSTHVYELRTYTAAEGKLANVNARFRDHTRRIFDKHNMKSIGYWTPQDAPLSQNTLIYILEHPSREAAKKAWADFQADPEWQKVSTESQVNGRIVSKVVSVFADPTDYSPMK